MDIAVNLVEGYLRLTGYLTLSEFEVQARSANGGYETITDVDVVGVRMPGAVYVGDPHDAADLGVLLIDDPELRLEEDCVDVIIGEVKEGAAVFNPAIKDHRVLHSVLRRLEWLYVDPLNRVLTGLQQHGVHLAAARGGGSVRTRLVAFGRADASSVNTIRLGHIVETLIGFFDRFDEALRPAQFKDPATGMLRLLHKAGYTIAR